MKKLSIIALACAAFATAAVAQTADVQIIHNSPDPAAVMVDIYLDAGDEPAIDNFEFRAATSVLPLPAGVEIVIGVAPGNSAGPGDIIASFPVTLMDGGSYLVMATGVLDDTLPGNPEGIDTAFTLAIFDGLTTTAPGGTTNLLAYHGAPDAPTVDVQVRNGPILVDDLAYTDFQGYLNAEASDLVLEVTLGMDNDTVVAAYDAPLSALDGAGAVVFASGFLSGDDMQLPAFGLYVALGDGTVIPLSPAAVAVENRSFSGVRGIFE
jgi:hypothetical protein